MRVATLVTLLVPLVALAQVPAKLGYQGRLLKSDGTPESGVVTVGFTVYATPTGTTPLWSEQQSLGLTDGFYSTFLGEAVALPPSLFDGSERWLEISIGSEVLLPRQRVDSVAYALKSGDSFSLAGRAASEYQVRVSGACPAGNYVTAVNADGTVTCAVDQQGTSGVTAVNASPPLTSSGGSTPTLGLTSACAMGQVLSWSGAAWQCTTPGSYSAGPGISIASGVVSLGACPSGQVWKSNGAGWACADDLDTTYAAGAGLLLTGNTFSANTSVVQQRVVGTCSAGSFVTAVNADGTVTCGSSALPTGMIIFFNGTACPAGFTEVSAARGRYVVGFSPVNPATDLGATVGTALGDKENRDVALHSHTIMDPGHNHTTTVPGTTGNGASAPQGGIYGDSPGTFTSSLKTTGITVNAYGSVAGTTAPYIQFLVCQKT